MSSPVVSTSTSPVVAAAPKTILKPKVAYNTHKKVCDERDELKNIITQQSGDIALLQRKIEELQEQLAKKSRERGSGVVREKKYKGQRIKKENMAEYDKAALDTELPNGWTEPKPHSKCFTYGIPLNDDGDLIKTGYIYNGLRWTTEEFADAVAECMRRADIRSLHYEKGYWHAKTGCIVRGKSSEKAPTSRVFIKAEHDNTTDKAKKELQATSDYPYGSQSIKDEIAKWNELYQEKKCSTDEEKAEFFRSIRFPSDEITPINSQATDVDFLSADETDN